MGEQSENHTKSVEINSKPPAGADFETAIDAAGFGIFNILLLLVALPAAIATVFETSTMSYLLPSAECDLKLSMLDKGILNAITYAGMITSAIAWGYIADTKGRKKILVFGYLVDAICVFGSSFSQNMMQLMIFKYFGGFVVCGPFAVLMSYLNELHGKQYRARVMMIIGMMFTIGSILLPVLALIILPSHHWDFEFFGLAYHPWQIFLAVSASPSLLSGILLTLFPESPKFLMSQGRNVEALKVFRKIYAINRGHQKAEYPINELINELEVAGGKHLNAAKAVDTIATIEGVNQLSLSEPTKRSTTLTSTTTTTAATTKYTAKVSFREGLQQIRPLFTKPYLGLSLRVYFMNFCILLGQNTLRLWLPQLFASITEYAQISSNDDDSTKTSTSICDILEYSNNKTANVENSSVIRSCEVVITAATYSNNIIVALAGLCGYIVAGTIIDRIGGKRILTLATLIASVCGGALYWSSSSLTTLIVSAVFVTMGSISSTSVIGASVNLFPTSLRTMILSLAMMFGRCGSLLGNILFPTFIAFGCIPPFLMVSGVMLVASILSAFLPGTNKIALK